MLISFVLSFLCFVSYGISFLRGHLLLDRHLSTRIITCPSDLLIPINPPPLALYGVRVIMMIIIQSSNGITGCLTDRLAWLSKLKS